MFLGLAVVKPLSRDLGLVLEYKPFHNPVPPLLQLWFPEAPLHSLGEWSSPQYSHEDGMAHLSSTKSSVTKLIPSTLQSLCKCAYA